MLLYLSTMGETLAKNFRRIYSRLCSRSSGRHDNVDEDDNGRGRVRSDGNSKRMPPNTVSSNHVGATDYIGGGGGDYYHHRGRYEFETISGAASYDRTDAMMSGVVGPSSGGQKRVPVLLSLSVVAAYVALGAFIYQKLEQWTLLEGSYFCFTSLGTIGFGELVPGGVESTKDVSVFVSSGYILVGMAVVAMCFQLLQDELATMSRNCRWCCCWWWLWSHQHQEHRLQKDVVVCTVAGTVGDDDDHDDDNDTIHRGTTNSPPGAHLHSRGGRQPPPHLHNSRNNGVAATGS